jgi:signal peptidase I
MGSRTGYSDGRATRPTPPPKSWVRDYLETIIVCVIFLIFTRAFAFQQSKIPSGSMEDTLLVGDYIMVNRFVYAPSSFDWERKLLPAREVRRGDVVVFKFPLEPEVDYIKRIVGLPGDTIELREGYLYVNGRQAQELYVNSAYRRTESFGPISVPVDAYFALGDHRDRSADSRVWGFVPRDLIKGRALLIWLSYDETAATANPQGFTANARSIISKALHPNNFRWRRCFTIIR